MLLSFITSWGLRLLQQGEAAPLWRRIVSFDNMLALNVISAAAVTVFLAYVAKSLWLRADSDDGPLEKPARFTPWLLVLPFLVVPAFARSVVSLSPFVFSLVPCMASLAVLVSAARRTSGFRLFLAGALAAVGLWESSVGVAMAFLSLTLAAWTGVSRGHSVTGMLSYWMLGFIVSFLTEGCCLGWPWTALSPSLPVPPLSLVAFLFLFVIPVFVVRALGERWWVMTSWGLLLAIFAGVTLSTGAYTAQSASERFVRRALSSLGERKLIIGDGFFDDYFRAFKPADVRFVGTRSNEDREFLINRFGRNDVVTNVALVVRQCYDLPEMADAAKEVGLVRSERKPEAKSSSVSTTNNAAARALAATNAFLRTQKEARPLIQGIDAVMNGLRGLSADQRRAKIDEVRQEIRKAWKKGMHGSMLSTTILTLDTSLGDMKSAESDALTALMLNRDDPAANAVLGSVRLQGNRIEEAENYLTKAGKAGVPAANNDLAVLYMRTKRLKDAEGAARAAVAKDPKDWNFRETLVQVLLGQKRYDEAASELDVAEKLAKQKNEMKQASAILSADRLRLQKKK